jgi:hypothetical protein
MKQRSYTGLGKLAMEIAVVEHEALRKIHDDYLAGNKEEALAGLDRYFAAHWKPKPKPVDREQYANEDRDREKARA